MRKKKKNECILLHKSQSIETYFEVKRSFDSIPFKIRCRQLQNFNLNSDSTFYLRRISQSEQKNIFT